MNSKDTYNRFSELLINNSIKCTESELNDFEMCGLLIGNNNKYITRTGEVINVEVIKTKLNNLDLNLSNIISSADKLAKENNIKRLYFMTKRCYDNYNKQGLIIKQGDNDYYRLFDKERWLVCVVD